LLLTVAEEKTEVLVESPLDYAVVIPFTPTLAAYHAEQFVDDVLRGRLGMRELLIGYDHGLGRGRAGDAELLVALGARRGFRVDIVPAVQARDGRPISSTSIRRAVAGGDLLRAADGLGRPYSVSGVVVPGARRGRVLGFSTLNLAPTSRRKLLPPQGVYAIRVQTVLGSFGGMLNLGPRPTFGESETTLEAHLFDADGDWYGTRVRVDFIAWLRETRKFPDAAALVRQLGRDEQMARIALGRNRAGL
jgi:riboflavin kinase/FMN adenylyltransferase